MPCSTDPISSRPIWTTLFAAFSFALVLAVFAPAWFAPAWADEESCDTHLDAAGNPVTSCTGADLVPQATTPDKHQMRHKLGDLPHITVYDPSGMNVVNDCNPSAGECPLGYEDGMLNNNTGFLPPLEEGAGDGDQGISTID
ncbi:MAG: hypothetical protein HOO00_07475 [Rhodospirillaceae bacterium]|nr:hypothetical protein [Rhodospirillaceae bacterium]MBT5373469.1 hypothetical protein [Rhodospirillaceae bacterium]MBT5752441.1 hypothetical protein [Rhodospirillaceae bacterium]